MAQLATSDLFLSSQLRAAFAGYSVGDVDQWIRQHFRYRPEREEVVRSPAFMLAQLRRDGFFEGDCDDVSVMAAAILKALGYVVRYTAIRYNAAHDEFEHVFVEAYSNGWYRLDATVPPGTIHHEIERMTEAV